MSRHSAIIATVLVGLALSAGSTLSMELEITPFAGTSVPNQTAIITDGGGGAFRNRSHVVLGLGIGTPVAPWLDLELLGAVGGGTFELVSAQATELSSSLVSGDLRGRVRLLGGDNAQLSALAGVGWTQYRNLLWDAYNHQDSSIQAKGKITGVVGLGVRARLSERLRLTVDAVDRIHDYGLEGESLTGLTQPTQHDLTITAGLAFPLN